MSSDNLLEVQQAFSESIFDAGQNRILGRIKGTVDKHKNERLDIYRNNVFHSLTEALADLYPIIQRLVGEQFFAGTAAEYIRQCPVHSAAMHSFGADFPEFLSEFEHTASLLYLPDVARVELARHHAYHAEDSSVLSAADFSAVHPDRLARAQFALHPSLTLLRSPFPVWDIWNVNQKHWHGDEVVDLDSGGVALAVYRPGFDVYIRELNVAACALLVALQNGDTLEVALNKAGEVGRAGNMPEILAWCIHERFFNKIVEGEAHEQCDSDND